MASCVRLFNAKVRTRRVKVGRAVHCAPGLLVWTRSFGLNPVLRALTSAATAGDHPARKRPLTSSTHLVGTAAKMAARQSAQRRRESVGRAVHCAPGLGCAEPASRARILPSAPLRARLRASNLLVREKHPVDSASGGQRTARPTNPVVTARATLGRSKFCIEEQGFVRAGFCTRSGYTKLWLTRKSCQSTEPKAVLEHRAPKASTPILHTRGVASKVGRAVHCAPGWLCEPGLWV